MKGYFFNAEPTADLVTHPTGYDRAYDADDHAGFFAPLFTEAGVLGGQDPDACLVYPVSGNTLGVKPGAAWVRGRMVVFDGTERVTAAGTGKVVVRMNKSADVRAFQLLAVPAVVQAGDIYDLELASWSGGVLSDTRTFLASTVRPPNSSVPDAPEKTGELVEADKLAIVDSQDGGKLKLSLVSKLKTLVAGWVPSLGRKTGTTVGVRSFALGFDTEASGQCSHAECRTTKATGPNSHAEGWDSVASADSAHAEGCDTKASGHNAHSEGKNTEASGFGSHAEGYGSVATKTGAHAEGKGTKAEGENSHAEGEETQASGGAAHAEGGYTTATGMSAHAEGELSTAGGRCSHAEGRETVASGQSSHAEGENCKAEGFCAHAEGQLTEARSDRSHAAGYLTVAISENQYVIGSCNVPTAGSLFVIGGGVGDTMNVFRVHSDGGVFASGTYDTGGADYAELFEWVDGNPEGMDRVGLFVALDGEKIRLAGPEDGDILGAVSAVPSVLGDVFDDQWKDMYLRDVFGRVIYEDQELPAELDGDGNVVRAARTAYLPKPNPAYRSEEGYIPRTHRPEWDAVGMLGKLVVIDDGSCVPNGYCQVAEGGCATAADAPTRFRVLARIDDSHIRILIR